jgi:hypothetical protein
MIERFCNCTATGNATAKQLLIKGVEGKGVRENEKIYQEIQKGSSNAYCSSFSIGDLLQ